MIMSEAPFSAPQKGMPGVRNSQCGKIAIENLIAKPMILAH
jgi:hypothetical protein